MPYKHIPAMLNEVLCYLNCRPGKIYVDCTLGGSGHARAICEKIVPHGWFIGIDQDRDAISNAQHVLQDDAVAVHLFHGNFVGLPEFLSQLQIPAVDGILLDLGLSLDQLEDSGRGFTFKKNEPLDMRMDVRSAETAEDLLNHWPAEKLRAIFERYGEERWAKQIARNIVRARRRKMIRTTAELTNIVISALPKQAAFRQKIHPATRVFMALRIAVNHELESLKSFLERAVDYLNGQGRLCVLSFHSLEDRIVKQRFKALAKGCTCPPAFPKCVCGHRPVVRMLTKRVVRPTLTEVAANPMARSTRLRAIEKL
jgi:16S rRNA (cytosine1402-N4)-methyltransferase